MKFFAIILLLFPVCVLAQQSFSLKIIPQDRDTSFLTRDFSYRNSFADTTTRNRELISLMSKLNKHGYLESSYQSFQKDSSKLRATIFIGKQWEWASLRNGNLDELILSRIGFREKLYSNKPFSSQEINRLMESVLQYCENNGFPFASVNLDSFQFRDNKLSAKIFLKKNILVTIDSISINGDAIISKTYLANYMGLRLPSVYKEDVVTRMNSRIRELPFITETKSPQVLFNNDHSSITLFLNKKNASRFDFILGVLPNNQTTGKLLVTGDGTLNLVNPFGRGENLFMHFSKLQTRTAQADITADYPYLFNMPFGIDGEFHLYKNDSLYVDIKEQFGFKFLFTGVNYFKLFFRNAATNILTFDSTQIINSKQLPLYLDSRTKYYGLEYQFENLDYRINPGNGWYLLLQSEVGSRKVKENAGITQLTDPGDLTFEFSSLYDSLESKETQFVFKAALDKYWQLTSRSIVKTSYKGSAIISNNILQNELFRIGGFKLLRGFDEESIYASQFHLLSAEYHYLLSRNSYFYLFFDGAYVLNETAVPEIADYPLGFGAGINFETRAGVFGLSYALGRQQNNPIEIRSAKLHFGYLNYF
jgi:hypothetical protein